MLYYVGIGVVLICFMFVGHTIDKLRHDVRKMKELWYDRFGEYID